MVVGVGVIVVFDVWVSGWAWCMQVPLIAALDSVPAYEHFFAII